MFVWPVTLEQCCKYCSKNGMLEQCVCCQSTLTFSLLCKQLRVRNGKRETWVCNDWMMIPSSSQQQQRMMDVSCPLSMLYRIPIRVIGRYKVITAQGRILNYWNIGKMIDKPRRGEREVALLSICLWCEGAVVLQVGRLQLTRGDRNFYSVGQGS